MPKFVVSEDKEETREVMLVPRRYGGSGVTVQVEGWNIVSICDDGKLILPGAVDSEETGLKVDSAEYPILERD